MSIPGLIKVIIKSRVPSAPPLAVALWIGLLAIQTQLSWTAEWRQFGSDAQFTSCNPSETALGPQNVKQVVEKWGIGCDDMWFSVIFRSPAVYKNMLFTSGAGNRLTAYDAQTGEVLWQFGDGNVGWAPQPVVSKDGTVFYMEGAYPTNLYAVKAETGKQLWKAPVSFDLGFEGAAYAVPTVDDARGAVYVVENKFAGDGKLYAISKRSGQVLWYKSKSKDKVAFRGHFAALKGSSLFATATVEESYFERDKVARIDTRSKKILMYYERPGSVESYDIAALCICNDILLVVYADRDDVFASKGVLVAYKINSTKAVWQATYSNSAVTGKLACNPGKNIVYVPTDPYLYAYNALTGKLIWKYTGYGAIYTPSVANGVIYFLSDTNMYAIDEQTKKRLRTFSLGYEAEPSTQVAVCDGMIYFSGDGGTCDLYALGLPASDPPAVSTIP